MNGKNRYDNLLVNLSNANYRDNGTDRYRNIFNTGASEHGASRFSPELSIIGENGLIANTDDIGLVLLSADISYVITNTSTSAMAFGANAVTITDEVNVTANVTSQPISIAPGQTTGFTINVTPTTSGVLSFTVNIVAANVMFSVVGQGNVAVVTFEYSSDGNTFFDLNPDDVIDLADNITGGTLTIRVNSASGQSTVENISTSSGDLVEDDSPPITVSADSFEDLTFTPTSTAQNDYSVEVQLTINGQLYSFTFSFDIIPELLAGFTARLDANDGTPDSAFTALANTGSAGSTWTSNTMLVKAGGVNSNQYVQNLNSTSSCGLTGKVGTDLFSTGTGMFGTIIRSVINSCSSDWNDSIIMFGDGIGINKCNTTFDKLRGYRYSSGSAHNNLPVDDDEWACIVHRWGGGQLYTRCVTSDSDTGWLQVASADPMVGASISSIAVFGPRPSGGGTADCDGVLFASYSTQSEADGNTLMDYLIYRAGF